MILLEPANKIAHSQRKIKRRTISLVLGFDGVILSGFVFQTSSLLEVERFPYEGYGLGERRGAESKGSFDNARITSDVFDEIEDRRWPLCKARIT